MIPNNIKGQSTARLSSVDGLTLIRPREAEASLQNASPTSNDAPTYLELQPVLPPRATHTCFTASAITPQESLTFVHSPVESARPAGGPHVEGSPTPSQAMDAPSLESEPRHVRPHEESRKTVLEWLAGRVTLYGTAELAGSVTAAIGIGLTGLLYRSSAAVGIIGTISENIGLYSALLYVSMRNSNRALEEQGKSHTWQTRAEVARKLVAQFGVAEVLDSLLLRPTLMGFGGALGWYLGEHLLGQGLFAMATGALGCKILADVFYWSMVEATGVALNKATKEKSA